ncbi:MAG: hypothetical protein P0Y56_03570 [Candidatus Andeanibacterium colombiense]|uniref:DUF3617 family protein n=1 Tax=Candidatus Andeanibacterium colombiense TaxID=3121345 RepID=A0AAJ6BNS0_9SPHN|nr:MAG: hypothetical protein P0Y56_03570 [Sphingomonadaceae bacterium]
MHKTIRAGAFALALAGLAASVPAEAKTKEEAWAAWVERAERIDFALKVQDERVYKVAIKDACTGVTGTIISQGMQFPAWGRELMGVCQVAKDTWLYGGKKGKYCKAVKQSAKTIGKAEVVPEAPKAAPLAQDIAEVLMNGYELGGCK